MYHHLCSIKTLQATSLWSDKASAIKTLISGLQAEGWVESISSKMMWWNLLTNIKPCLKHKWCTLIFRFERSFVSQGCGQCHRFMSQVVLHSEGCFWLKWIAIYVAKNSQKLKTDVPCVVLADTDMGAFEGYSLSSSCACQMDTGMPEYQYLFSPSQSYHVLFESKEKHVLFESIQRRGSVELEVHVCYVLRGSWLATCCAEWHWHWGMISPVCPLLTNSFPAEQINYVRGDAAVDVTDTVPDWCGCEGFAATFPWNVPSVQIDTDMAANERAQTLGQPPSESLGPEVSWDFMKEGED